MRRNLTIYSHHPVLCTPLFLCTFEYNFSFWCVVVPNYFYLMEYNAGHYITNKNEVKELCVSQEKIKGG